MVYDNIADAVTAAIAENEARLGMHPLEKCDAYLARRLNGMTDRQIAAAFCVTEVEVTKITALQSLAPCVRDAFRQDKLTLDQARAFSLGALTDQTAHLALCISDPWKAAPARIRAAMAKTACTRDQMNKITFIGGLDAYAAAGGVYTSDLFSDIVMIDSPALLEELTAKRLGGVADRVSREGWSWVSHETPAEFKQLHGAEPEISDEDAERLEELSSEADEGGLSDADADELDRLCILQESMLWSDDQMAVSGAVVMLDAYGELMVRRGVLAKEDYARAVELGVVKADRQPAAESDADAETGMSSSLMMDLEGLEVLLMQKALMRKPELALAVLAATLQGDRLMEWHTKTGEVCMTQRETESGSMMRCGPFGVDLPALPEAEGDGLTAMMADKRGRNAVLAHGVATGLSRYNRRHYGPLREALGFRMRDHWTPGEALFKRMKASMLSDIYEQTTGLPLNTINPKQTKAEKVVMLAELFADTKTVVANLTAHYGDKVRADAADRVKAWMPDTLMPRLAPDEIAVDEVANDEMEDGE